jgi:hypothetical protein
MEGHFVYLEPRKALDQEPLVITPNFKEQLINISSGQFHADVLVIGYYNRGDEMGYSATLNVTKPLREAIYDFTTTYRQLTPNDPPVIIVPAGLSISGSYETVDGARGALIGTSSLYELEIPEGSTLRLECGAEATLS